MVTIPTFNGRGKTVAPVSQFQADPRVASKGAAVAAKGLGEALNIELSQFAETRRQADRAELLAEEARYNTSLTNFLPKAISQIGQTASNTMNAISAIDEQERVKEEGIEAKSFLFNRQYRLTEDLFNAESEVRQSAGADGAGFSKGMTEWMNQRIERDLQEAPNEKAQLAYMDYANQTKLSVLQNSLNTENDMRIESRLQSLNETGKAKARIAKQSPEMAPQLLEGLNEYSNQLKKEGVPEEAIDNAVSSVRDNIKSSQVDGLIAGNDPYTAVGVIAQSGSDEVGDKAFIQSTEKALQAQEDQINRETQALTDSQLLQSSRKGIIVDPKEQAKASDILFAERIANFDETNDPFLKQVALMSFFNDPKAVLGKKTKGHMAAKINSNDPDEAVLYANVITQLAEDPKTSKIVSSLDSKTRTEALRLGQLTGSMSPQEAIDLVRGGRINVNPGLRDIAKKEIRSIVSDNKEFYSDIVEDALDFGFFSGVDDTAVAQSLAREVFDAKYLEYRDEETAAKEAQIAVRNKFQVTEVNGDNELTTFAPESIYNPQEMEEFIERKDTTLATIRTQLNLPEDSELKIQPVIGLTNQQGRDNTTYMVTDKVGNFILADDGNYMTYEFDATTTRFNTERIQELETQRTERDDLNNKFKEHKARISKTMSKNLKNRKLNPSPLIQTLLTLGAL